MSLSNSTFATINKNREHAGYLAVEETMALGNTGNIVFDPFSTLVSRYALIGANNVFYPNVLITANGEGLLKIGSGNTFHSNTILEAVCGSIAIGSGNQLGEGAFCAKANSPGAEIVMGNSGRYCGQIALFGKTILGTGCQILGNITVYDCSLDDGQAHNYHNPDERGAVLKGLGTAKDIHLFKGYVINGWGTFSALKKTKQSFYHPAES